MDQEDKKKEYKRICNKLGCEPKDIKIPEFDTEDDRWVNPASVLTVEEIDFLWHNGYLEQRKDGGLND